MKGSRKPCAIKTAIKADVFGQFGKVTIFLLQRKRDRLTRRQYAMAYNGEA